MFDPTTKPVPTIIQGAYRPLTIVLADLSTRTPFDLRGATEIEAQFKKADGSVLTKRLSTAGIVILDAVVGKFKVMLGTSDTSVMSIGLQDIEVQVTFDVGTDPYIVQIFKAVKVTSQLYAG